VFAEERGEAIVYIPVADVPPSEHFNGMWGKFPDRDGGIAVLRRGSRLVSYSSTPRMPGRRVPRLAPKHMES
jgi:hypothetical protein